MRTFASISALLAITLAIAGCGGGDSGCGKLNSGTGSGSSSSASCVSTTSGVASVAISSAGTTIPADGSATVQIVAIPKDANNAAIANVAVTFAASAGNLVITQGTTDKTGNAIATLAVGGAAVGTAIKVTASVGSISASTTITVAATSRPLRS